MSTSRSMVIQLDGDKGLEAAFNALALNLQKKVFRPALRAGGKVLLKAIKARVPRDTGNLARAIKLRAGRRSRKSIGVAVFVDKSILKPRPQPKNPKPGAREGWHPAHVELGHVRRTKRGTVHVPPKSFIRAGFDASKEQAHAAIVGELERRMAQIYVRPETAAAMDEGSD